MMRIIAALSAEAASTVVSERRLETVNMRGPNEQATAGRFESDRRQGFSLPPERQAEETTKAEAPEKGQEKWLKGVIYIIPKKNRVTHAMVAKE